ncbi:MAG: hypothetical protein WCX48_07150 [Bacteroidales bacterium]
MSLIPQWREYSNLFLITQGLTIWQKIKAIIRDVFMSIGIDLQMNEGDLPFCRYQWLHSLFLIMVYLYIDVIKNVYI